MMNFNVGDKVWFMYCGEVMEGELTKINKKTVRVGQQPLNPELHAPRKFRVPVELITKL